MDKRPPISAGMHQLRKINTHRLPIMNFRSLLLLASSILPLATQAAEAVDITPAINALGLDLYRQQIKTADGKSVLLSPYSIATALAMTYAGAEGDTKAEMQRVLRLPADQQAGSAGFRRISDQLAQLVRQSESLAEILKRDGEDAAPVQLSVANCLFPQAGYPLLPPFIEHLSHHFGSKLDSLDYRSDPEAARVTINRWVAGQTQERIPELLVPGILSRESRLVLVNALYLRAAWHREFDARDTQDRDFHLTREMKVSVPTMFRRGGLAYEKRRDYTIVALPYQESELQCVLLVPDRIDGLAALEKKLVPGDLRLTTPTVGEVHIFLPKFKLQPAVMSLGSSLHQLGLGSAFDIPRGSANFSGIALRQPTDYLFLSEVVHQTWLSLDEKGTEAAAATAAVSFAGSAGPQRTPPPLALRADRPFMFAVMHVSSGTCLFLGRVTDPRSE